ncbi:MAG: methyl-accepting chemotaxis protein [Lachnospiraceae bacterium]|nr:methyl-accepting chemotaxis protein [Lachnospiraceae bacterium]
MGKKEKKLKEKKVSRSKVKFGLRAKLTLTIIPFVVIAVLAISTLMILKAQDTITSRSMDLLETQADKCTDNITTDITEVLAEAKIMHGAVELVTPYGDAFINLYLYGTLSYDEKFPYGVYMGDKNGTYYDQSGWVPDADWVCYERDWYKDGLNNDEMAFGEPYVDAQTGELCVSASCKVRAGGANNLVMAIDVYLNNLAEEVKQYKVLDNGYCVLITATGDRTVLACKDEKLLGMTYDDAKAVNGIFADGEEVFTNADGETHELTIDGEKYVLVANEVPIVNWVVLTIVPYSDITSTSHDMMVFGIGLALAFVLAIIIAVGIIVSKALKPLYGITDNIQKMAEGDFTIKFKHKGTDEIALMGKELEDFTGTMQGIIREITGISGTLATQADSSTNVSNELYSSATSTSDSMDELRTTVQHLADSITEVANNTVELANNVTETGKHGREAAEKMDSTVKTTALGKEGMEKIKTSMNEIENEVAKLADAVSKVGDSTGEITKFVEMIGNIASQTNLLSLNAAIEAARAGEAGKGFSVVAGEVRNLADTSTTAVAEISSITDGINALIENAISETKKSVDAIRQSAELVEEVGGSFDDIFASIDEASALVKDMVREVEEIDRVAASVAAITETQSANTQEILATAENLSSLAGNVSDNSEHVASEAENIANTADTLSEHMKGFKVE